MRTRDERGRDHDHPDQSNVAPRAPLAEFFDRLLLPAPQHAHRAQALRDAWEPRNNDPRTLVTNPRAQELPRDHA